MDHIERILTLIMLVAEWKSVLLPELAGFADMAVLTTKSRQAKNNVLHLHFKKPREVNMDEPLVP